MAGTLSQKGLVLENGCTLTSPDAVADSPNFQASMTTISLEDDKPMCRICHSTSSKQRGKHQLIKPCLCSGTLGYVHRSCLERWLTITERKTCTICEFTFKTRQEMKPMREWMWPPMSLEDVLLLIGTILAQLTMLIQLSSLFLVAAQHYHGKCPTDLAIAIGGITVGLPWTVVMVTVMTVNLIMSPYWQTWRSVNRMVRLVLVEPRPKISTPTNVIHVDNPGN